MTDDKDFISLHSAILDTYFEDAKDMNTDFTEDYRHACSAYTKGILNELGIDRKAFLKSLKATRRQARFEYRQHDNLKYQKETTKSAA